MPGLPGLRGGFVFAVLAMLAAAAFAHPGYAQPDCATSDCDQPACGERFYLLIHGAQSKPFRFRYTHNWVTLVKTMPAADGDTLIFVDTISWMPATLAIHPLHIRRQPGVNLTDEETMDWAREVHAHVCHAGPYEIDCDHYHRLLARKNELECGPISYRAIGALTRHAPISNCGQSFARASPIVGRRWQPVPVAGVRGAYRLANRYGRCGLIDKHVTHDWLLTIVLPGPMPDCPIDVRVDSEDTSSAESP